MTINAFNREILCTVGPSSLNERVIARLEDLGVSLFRINLSHTKIDDLPRVVDFIRSRSNVPVCLDTEGAQIRTGDIVQKEIVVRENSIVHLPRTRVPGDAQAFNLYPTAIVDELELGDFISIDFNSVLVQVVDKTRERVSVRVVHGGVIGQNKAVTVERDILLDTLTEKDILALAFGRANGIRHVALSFANRASDVAAVRALSAPDLFLISKIECRNGLINLDEIAAGSDALLIDRGDLSRQEPIERIPLLQKMIIARGKALGRKVYVATNLLESMITAPKPTRAEVNDVINTLIDGADGLVLAAETAIGRDPIGCVAMIVKLLGEFGKYTERKRDAQVELGEYLPESPGSLLVDPHGGTLVDRNAGPDTVALAESLPRLVVPETAILDLQQIAVGTYSPLTGFMDRATLDSVLHEHRLPNGLAWSMPIVLQLPRAEAENLAMGSRVALTDEAQSVLAVLTVSETYRYDLDALATLWFGTDSTNHPGVARLKQAGEHFIAGDIELVRARPSLCPEYELTPHQARFIFSHKGWDKVVGFHSRNVIHRVHEHIQLAALERTHADGLFINPVIGPKKPGDFLPLPILKSYQLMIDFGIYPAGKVLLGALSSYPRYSGPREAVFTALCRKNMGCSHFIIGRNHAGVGDYYHDRDYPALFERLGDIGIEPLFFDAIGYNEKERKYEALGEQQAIAISGTEVRDALTRGDRVPDWFMRDLIQEALIADVQAGRPIFHAA